MQPLLGAGHSSPGSVPLTGHAWGPAPSELPVCSWRVQWTKHLNRPLQVGPAGGAVPPQPCGHGHGPTVRPLLENHGRLRSGELAFQNIQHTGWGVAPRGQEGGELPERRVGPELFTIPPKDRLGGWGIAPEGASVTGPRTPRGRSGLGQTEDEAPAGPRRLPARKS
ncbi:unnamed protein product [Rangifer tarandus platyrhynchus]|uniref:Uncharacterized protein n=1 Tax=Rangifer tarandus platyrhynchus TaxID=3082113 RepID=A0AC59YEJ8_RANTA